MSRFLYCVTNPSFTIHFVEEEYDSIIMNPVGRIQIRDSLVLQICQKFQSVSIRIRLLGRDIVDPM